TPNLTSEDWGAFETVAKGPNAGAQLDHDGKRYMQWQATLETEDPLATPVVESASVSRTLAYDAPPANTFYVLNYKNPRLRQTSYEYAYEDSDTPQLARLRERLGLDALLEDATGDFDKINRLRHFVSQLWRHGSPLPEYPEWNALDVLDRRERVGKGGMCIQFSIVFIQSLQSLGYQARHINIFN
ncbi:MAG: transglutaminase-like domain-containing protein, partial [Candidatus Hydrogenedentes bacterium]|nr:transglutaminase-like domain-containing protein [Candidatus Hydrogenedentota bacterium]